MWEEWEEAGREFMETPEEEKSKGRMYGCVREVE